MSVIQHEAFSARAQRLFNISPGPIPRLIWVLGPPGAGKTTWAMRAAGAKDRVMDIDEVLFWRDGADMGVLTAKRHAIDAIRATEAARPDHDRRLLVTGSYMPLDALKGLAAHEHIVTVIPPRQIWSQRLTDPDGAVAPQHAEAFSAWVERFGYGPAAAARVAEAMR
jgi:hypothetical protein